MAKFVSGSKFRRVKSQTMTPAEANYSFARDINFTRWLFWLYLVVLFLLPIPLGSNRPLFWSVFVFAVSSISLAWAAGAIGGVTRWHRSMRPALLPVAILALFVAWSGMKVVAGYFYLNPMNLSGQPEVLQAPSTTALQPGSFFYTASWHDSADALLLSIGLLLLAFLTVVLVCSTRRVLQVLSVLVLAGLVQAIYGSFMLLSGTEWGFFEPKQFGRGLATGTFINRNHFANLLVLSLSAGTGLLLAQMDLRGYETMRQRLRSFLKSMLGPKARLRVFMIVTVIALVLSRSRMGNASFFAALSIVGLFAIWRLRQPSRPLVVLVMSVLIIDIFVIGTWFGVEQVIDRIQQTVQVQPDQEWLVQDKNRIDADRESINIIMQAPWTGWGGGTFYTVYPAWRGDDQMFMDHAHNDYLEFAIEYGLPGLLLLACFIFLCARRAAQGLVDRNDAQTFGIAFASLMAMVAMLIHATVDFSLQIPANAAWFVVLCILPFRAKFQP